MYKTIPTSSNDLHARAVSSRSTSDTYKGSKRPQSPFFAPKPPPRRIVTTPNGTVKSVKDVDEEKKTSILGAAFNLCNNIVGAGLVGIPFAISQCSFILGSIMVAFFGLLTIKSLRLLIETAKYVNVPSYERLAEASFGKQGFTFISAAMFIMAYGGMVGYLMIIKENLSYLLGVDAHDTMMQNAVLVLSSLTILLPISMQRDMGNLAKTSILSVFFDCILVGIIAYFSPVGENIEKEGSFSQLISKSHFNPSSFSRGIGVLCFAFVCQHSSFIIASSLERPTKKRWNTVTALAISTCVVLALIMGMLGYLGFLADTDGDILVNFGKYAEVSSANVHRASDIARALLCMTMFFVYPMEIFVARHVCVVLLFKGRRAHEGDDHAILARRDRRITVTTGIYILTLLPALVFDDLGVVFSLSGALGGATLSYIGPGFFFLSVHGSEFLDLVELRWGYKFIKNYKDRHYISSVQSNPHRSSKEGNSKNPLIKSTKKGDILWESCDSILWYLLMMPLWCKIAAHGKKTIKAYREAEAVKSPYQFSLGQSVMERYKYQGLNRNNSSFDSNNNNQNIHRVGSVPAFLKPRNSFTLGGSDGKKTVGFINKDSLGNQLSVNEKERLLTHYRPITADSFNSASFEVMRPQNSRSESETQESETNDVSQRTTASLFFIPDVENTFDIGLDLSNNNTRPQDKIDKNNANENSNLNTKKNVTDNGYRSIGQNIYGNDQEDIADDSSSVYVNEQVHDAMYESDSDSDASSVHVSPSPHKINKKILSTSSYDVIQTSTSTDTLSMFRDLKRNSDDQKGTSKLSSTPELSQQANWLDFCIAVFYILFGMTAAVAGVTSTIYDDITT